VTALARVFASDAGFKILLHPFVAARENERVLHRLEILSRMSEKPAEKKAISEELRARIVHLTEDAPVMVFIKGTPQAPRCKFSKSLIRLLMDNNITKFGYVDVLEDPDLRDGLKSVSQWETYPQVFVQGEFVGGLDIVTEQVQDGDFVTKVPKECFGSGLYPRLKKMLTKDKFTLALDGTPAAPRDIAGEQAVELLRKAKIDFGYVDISAEDAIRGGLKNYDRFTSYPQFYVDGELLGGIEKLNELASAGKLTELKTAPKVDVAKSA